MASIAQWIAGLFENIDLSPSDITAAMVLAAASQQQRRKMRIRRALAPKLGTGLHRDSSVTSETATTDTDSDATSEADLSGGLLQYGQTKSPA